MAKAFELISTVTVGSGGAATVTFSSIPATYTDLCVKFSLRCGATGTQWNNSEVTFNGSSANRTFIYVGAYNNGAPVTGTGAVALVFINHGNSPSDTFGNGEMYVGGYASTTQHKPMSFNANSALASQDSMTSFGLNNWAVTSAITSITFTAQSNVYTQYSCATLYGIKNS